jgi:CO/xanthine dehydrogenase Mo-binding subunit
LRVIEAGVVQGTSRALWEEVKFNNKTVTSVDWLSYPILDIVEAPESIDVVLIDRPELPPSGAGEPAIRPVARRSPMRCSTRPACASAACRSRPTM